MDIDKLDADIIESLNERGWTSSQIESEMSPEEAFDEYCEWHGLCRWGSELRRVMENLNESR